MNRFIYATNRSQLIYKFLIIDETETEYVVSDYDTTSYELSQVKFYIDKVNLCKARCEEKSWAFIVTEDFYASFSIEDVHKEYDKRQIEIITNAINAGEESLKELESKPQKSKKSYNNVCLNDFKLGDSVYVSLRDRLHKAKVVSFNTFDKINFTPNIECDFGNCLEDYTPLVIGGNGELHINVIEQSYDDVEYNDFKVFVSKEDYDIYLEICDYNKTEEIIVSKKRNIQQLKQRLEKLVNLTK
jgi:hypothetical protein